MPLRNKRRRAALRAALFGSSALLAAGEARASTPQSGQLDVSSFGANGDGRADDTAALQAAIDSRHSLVWPAGTYRVTSTLRFPSEAPPGGGYWWGEGMTVTNPQLRARKGPHTVLVWDGPAGGTLLEWSGLGGWRFENLSFVGRPTASVSNRAGILVHCRTHPSFGAAGYTFRDVSVWDADVCLQFGTVAADTNCDSALFERLVIGNATRGVVVKNDQGLLYQFVALGAGAVGTVIDLERGGHLLINQAAFNACGGPGLGDFCIRLQRMESNAQVAILDDVRVENRTRQVLQAGRASGRILVNGFNEAQGNQRCTMFETRGPAIEFHSSRFVSNDGAERPFKLASGGGGHKPAMRFSACSFADAPFRLASWFDLAAPGGVALEGCSYKATQERLPFLNNVAEWGEVTHFARTTDAAPTYASFGGSALHIPRDSLWSFEMEVLANPFASFHRRCLVQDRGGKTSLVGAAQAVGADVNPGGYAVAVDVQNGFVRARVTGIAGATIDWQVRFRGTALLAEVG